MKWIMYGAGLKPIKVKADSFDEAIKKARRIDKRYCGGCVDDDED